MSDLNTIFFDAAGTLIHLPRGVGWHYADVAARHGWKADAATLQRLFGMAWKRAAPPVTTRELRADDDRAWWQTLVAQVMEAADVPATVDREAYFHELYAEFARPGIWALYPDVAPVLEALAERYTLGVLSNFDGRLRTVLADLGILGRFAHCIISSEVGADKPDPWIFTAALQKCGGAPAKTMLVGDDLECDIHAAERAGWHAFLVERPRQTLHDLLTLLT